jgi:hypothetical protein
MVEEMRNHDPAPTEEERGWIDLDPFAFVLKVAAMAAIGLMIGVYASLLQEPSRSTMAEQGPDTRSAAVAETAR